MQRWQPRQVLSKKEQILMKRLTRTRKLFAFLRTHRLELFDEAFQTELDGMYRDTGAGREPIPPAQLCMALILQGYLGVSDAEAVELTVVDARWQMVLDCMAAEEPLFAQGTLQQFRQRLVREDMDRRLLERTRDLAKASKGFDWKKLPKELRVAVDSRPLEGAGRVEDTLNLLGHAARKIVEGAALITGREVDDVCRLAGIPLLRSTSIKTALDINWNDPEQRDYALETLLSQVVSLHGWLQKNKLNAAPEVQPYVAAVAQVRTQDLDETANGRPRIRQQVARDRRVSIEDKQMRHGRKSKSKRFNGYKEHLAADLDTDLIVACAVTPANVPEDVAAPQLGEDIERQQIRIGELSIDRAYINSTLVADVEGSKGTILCKPWSGRNGRKELFKKADFEIDMRAMTITCPAGHAEPFEQGQSVEFDPEVCGPCPMRDKCTYSASGGRTVKIADDERRQHRLRKIAATPAGRQRLRERVAIEHRLAHVAARKGPKARYLGTRANLYDLRRAAIIQNLETIQRKAA